jgi:hypothetical protein
MLASCLVTLEPFCSLFSQRYPVTRLPVPIFFSTITLKRINLTWLPLQFGPSFFSDLDRDLGTELPVPNTYP